MTGSEVIGNDCNTPTSDVVISGKCGIDVTVLYKAEDKLIWKIHWVRRLLYKAIRMMKKELIRIEISDNEVLLSIADLLKRIEKKHPDHLKIVKV